MVRTTEIILLVLVTFNLFAVLVTIALSIKSNHREKQIISDCSKYYAVCVCTKPKGQKVYKSFVTENKIDSEPTLTDLETLRNNVLNANPEFVDCVIVFFHKITG